MFMAPSTVQAPPQPAPTPPQPGSARPAQPRTARKAKQPNYVPLLIILGIVFLLAITLVLFFALRK
jgi:hypothetical protein